MVKHDKIIMKMIKVLALSALRTILSRLSKTFKKTTSPRDMSSSCTLFYIKRMNNHVFLS